MSVIYDRLTEYCNSEAYPFHMPGHKRRLKGDILNDITGIDITEIDGFDNLHDARDLILEAQQRAAKVYGAEESFFLVNGSTCGILSAVAACVKTGGWLMMGRNCHKAVYHAALLGRLNTIYMYPDVKEGFSFFDGFRVDTIKSEVEKFVETHPGEKLGAVIITSPTYEGIISDIKGIADYLHTKGIPLIVDEAHGAHLGMSKSIPENSCRLGADIVIHSLHKTMPAMTQTAILHVNGRLVDRQRLRRYLSIYQTSSPSYVLMASIDRALIMMGQDGEKYFKDFLDRKSKLVRALDECKRIRIYQGKDLDPCKLVLSTRGSLWTGKQLYDKLRLDYNIQMEMAAGDYLVAIMTVMDDEDGFERLENAVLALDIILDEEMKNCVENSCKVQIGKEKNCKTLNSEEKSSISQNSKMQDSQEVCPKCCSATVEYSIAEASDLPCMLVSLEEAKDRICADFVYVYPPGIPILVPGERITEEHILYFDIIRKQNLDLKGVSYNQIRVIQ